MTPYLQQRGIEVTESDLGERIQQLSGEPPSHIVVPAIHKLRSDVAALFAQNLGTDPRNLPQPAVPLPETQGFPRMTEPILPYFRRQLELMGGRFFEVANGAAARAKVAELFPKAGVICSATPEVKGTRRVQDVREPHQLDDVDIG